MLQVILVEFLSRRRKDESKQCMLPIFKETYIASLHPPLPTSTMLILLICSYPQYSQPYYNMYMFRQAFCKRNICKCNRPVTITRTLDIDPKPTCDKRRSRTGGEVYSSRSEHLPEGPTCILLGVHYAQSLFTICGRAKRADNGVLDTSVTELRIIVCVCVCPS